MNNGKHYKQCPYCEKSYVSTPAYSMHVRTHGQGYLILYFLLVEFKDKMHVRSQLIFFVYSI